MDRISLDIAKAFLWTILLLLDCIQELSSSCPISGAIIFWFNLLLILKCISWFTLWDNYLSI